MKAYKVRFVNLLFFLFSVSSLFADTTTVKSDCAFFDGDIITLTGNVQVTSENYQIYSKQASLLRDEKKQSRFDFPWMELSEGVKASFYGKYFLECDKVNVDYIAHTLVFTSKGKIFFHDEKSKLYAERAEVDYIEEQSGFRLAKITLLGDVELFSSNEKDNTEQYALADHVECYPKEEVIFLRASQEKRVLFFDKTREITMSADSVRATRNEGKEIIEGLGDVRFVFKEEELEKIKERFKLFQND